MPFLIPTGSLQLNWRSMIYFFLISISSLLKICRRKVLIAHENSCIDITGEILQCLKPGAWLNDEVIFLSVMHESHKILVAMLNLSSQVMLICI